MEPLERRVYVQVNKVLEALGGTWDRRARAHVFRTDARDAVDQVLADGTFTDARKEYDFFRTPHGLAEALVAAARIEGGHRVLEPSAGDGRIAAAIARAHPDARLDVCEIQSVCQSKLVTAGFALLASDFLSLRQHDGSAFERIVMNPPFSRGQDAAHIQHAWELLAPGGRLVAVAAAGVTFRADRATIAVRALVEQHGRCEPLPDGSFRESGTGVRTVRIVLTKPADVDRNECTSRALAPTT